jgi:RNA polymerase sigma-70 factor (ECF subfamily)
LCLQFDDLTEASDTTEDEALVHLPACLDALGQSAREALRMKYEGRLRLAEIGERLRRSVGAVKLLMYRARQALRRCLDHKLGLPS